MEKLVMNKRILAGEISIFTIKLNKNKPNVASCEGPSRKRCGISKHELGLGFGYPCG